MGALTQVAIESNFGKVEVNQVGHGFTLPTEGFIPVYYNNVSGNYEAAISDATETAADALITEILDTDNFTIQDGGVLEVTHGLDVGKWYVLSDTTAGEVVALDTLTGTDVNVQYLAFTTDANNILLRVDPIFTRDFFIPQDISILEDWTQGGSPTISAGTNRMLIVNVSWEDALGTSVNSMTVGGVTGDEVVEQLITSGFQNGSASYCWLESDIAAMSGSALSIGWSSGAADGFQTSQVLLEHADQATPKFDSNSDSGVGLTDTLDADINTLDGGYAYIVSSGGNTGMGFTNNGTGWTRKLNLTITSADGIVDDKLITADATPENANLSITGSNRHVMIAVSIRRQE